MSKKLVVTKIALKDIQNIKRHIALDSEDIATNFIVDLVAKIEWIAEVDVTGSPRDHIRKGLSAFPYRNRCIYFRSEKNRVVVLRVLHGAQDLQSQDFLEG